MAEPKKMQFCPIEREIEVDGTPAEHWVYTMMDRLIANHHAHLVDCRIKLFWAYEWKPDRDLKLKLGCARKVAEEAMHLTDLDIFIELNCPFFNDTDVEMDKKEAVLDHELCHVRPIMDKDTEEQKVDANSNKQWYLRSHDIEEFREIIERRGCYKQDLEEFAAALYARREAAAGQVLPHNQSVQEEAAAEGGQVSLTVPPIQAPPQPVDPAAVEAQAAGQEMPGQNAFDQLTEYEQPSTPPPPPE